MDSKDRVWRFSRRLLTGAEWERSRPSLRRQRSISGLPARHCRNARVRCAAQLDGVRRRLLGRAAQICRSSWTNAMARRPSLRRVGDTLDEIVGFSMPLCEPVSHIVMAGRALCAKTRPSTSLNRTESPLVLACAIAANSRKGTPLRKNKNLDRDRSRLYRGFIPIRRGAFSRRTERGWGAVPARMVSQTARPGDAWRRPPCSLRSIGWNLPSRRRPRAMGQ